MVGWTGRGPLETPVPPEVTVLRLSVSAALCAALLVLAAPAPAAQACANADARPGTIGPKRHARAVRCLLNAERSKRGVRGLRVSKKLSRAARGHARQMVRRDFFSHVSPSGSTLSKRLRRSRYRYRVAGENLAWATGRRATPRGLVNTMLRSGAHRRVLLSKRYRHVGVGVKFGSPAGRHRGAATLDAVFARRR